MDEHLRTTYTIRHSKHGSPKRNGAAQIGNDAPPNEHPAEPAVVTAIGTTTRQYLRLSICAA